MGRSNQGTPETPVVDAPSIIRKTYIRKRSVTETSLNRSVPFASARILVVCNKLETGYDDPLLQSMYVDRPLRGAHAVQVLSRLNRTSKGKSRVSVIDFVNTPSTLHAAFAAFWDGTTIDAGEAPRLYHSPRADSIVDQILAFLRRDDGASASATVSASSSSPNSTTSSKNQDNNNENNEPSLLCDATINEVASSIVRGGRMSDVIPLLEEYSEICNQTKAQKAALPKQYVDVLIRALKTLRSGNASSKAFSNNGTASNSSIIDAAVKDMKVIVNAFQTSYSGSIAIAPTRTSTLPWVPLFSNTISSSTISTLKPTKTTKTTTLSQAVASTNVLYGSGVVESLREAILHNISANDQVGMLNVLTRLSLVDVQVETLRKTGIGKVIRRLSDRNDIHTSVKTLANSIVFKWRKMVQHGSTRKKQSIAGQDNNGSGTNDNDENAARQLDLQRRNLSRKTLIKLVGGDSILGTEIELALYEKWCGQGKGGKDDFREYARVLKQIVANIRLNNELLLRLKTKTLHANQLVVMSTQEMATQEKKRKRLEQQEASELGQFNKWKTQIMTEQNTKLSEDVGECPRCQNNKCYIRHIPDHTSMAGVASRKPSTMAICAECENTWPIE